MKGSFFMPARFIQLPFVVSFRTMIGSTPYGSPSDRQVLLLAPIDPTSK